jgi:DNA-binding NtrC family response regulator
MVRAGARILIVDDEPDVRETLGEYLTSEGYKVIFAESALGALSCVREYHPDVVLLDLSMPGVVTGDAIIGAISKTTPVIVITAAIDRDVTDRALRDGAVDYIAKPFQLGRVGKVVKTVLAKPGRA